MKNPYGGYLSAKHLPFIVFYYVLMIAYSILGIIWSILVIISIKKILILQFVILAVIGLGFSEHFLFTVDYSYMNFSGHNPYGLIYVAEIVAALKKTIARLLVVIVCLGFGTVKPRLSTFNLRLLVIAGVIYFTAASLTGIIDSISNELYGKVWYLHLFILLLDFAWFYWIFTALISTRRALKLRRNKTKLEFYNALGIILIFSFVASLAFLIMGIYMFLTQSNQCEMSWNERRGDLIFWPSLFLIILIAIMIIWRPSTNEKRFAFVPLTGTSDDPGSLDKPLESEEGMVYR